MSTPTKNLIYTITDEAPALATWSLLPIIRAFARSVGISIETRDISLAGRIIATFPEKLSEQQRQQDDLQALGELAKTPDANIIKLPNISASIPQLVEAITELQSQGYDLPDYPVDPKTEEDKSIQARYGKVLGSAVNPVLREGNSDRRVAAPVKAYARKHPHSMGAWSSSSRSSVAHMSEGDFFGSEQSAVMGEATRVRIEFISTSGEVTVLKEQTELQAGEIIDAAVMSVKALRAFYAESISKAKEQDVLLSLHLKATMMKISDPIMFGHAVTVYFAEVFEQFSDELASVGINPDNGLGDLFAKIGKLPAEQRSKIETAITDALASGPKLAMVDSDRGITNLHVPNDVIIDASMPAALRSSGKMWGADGQLHDTLAMIPDRSYAGVYQQVIDFCKANGAFDVATMGNVSNVGLMAQKAEEYGSHDKTFRLPGEGTVRVVDASLNTVFEHAVEEGDIWRMCQTRDEPVRDWVRLAVKRARETGALTLFWLDQKRPHDANLIGKVNRTLAEQDTDGLDIRILPPAEACQLSMETIRAGNDTVSVTGNVLRDYLTDLFPILELGTSAKMLSIVPLLKGGGLFETGAGGSAPKHVQQLQKENHLRWDSLGEFLALAVSFEDVAKKSGDQKAQLLSDSLNEAIGHYLDCNRSPSRRVGELDNRGSHFYLAQYWANALANQQKDDALAERFRELSKKLTDSEERIVAELSDCQGGAVDLGGYYHPNAEKAEKAMRPSSTLNAIVDAI